MLRLVSSNTGWMLIRVTDTMSSGTNSAATPFMSITVVANTTVRYENLLSLAVHTTVEKSLLKRWCKSKSGTRPKIESAIADTFTSFYKDLRRLTKYKRLLFLFSSVKNHLPLYLLDKGKISAGQSLKVGLNLLDVPVPPFQVQQAGDEFVIKTLPDYPARVAGGYGIRRNV